MWGVASVSAVSDSSHLWDANSMPGPLVRTLCALSLSLEPHSYPMGQMLLSTSFYRRGGEGSERFRSSP